MASTVTIGLTFLAQAAKAPGNNEITAVLIVVVGFIAITIALAWRASVSYSATAPILEPAEGDAGITPRQLLLEKVERLWIREALHRSLRQAVQLEVRLDNQPGALADRFGEAWEAGGLQRLGDNEPLPPRTSLTSLLGERAHRRCLVLGEPGTGKTTHLLQLAEDLLELAQDSPGNPMPVVLLLSRWSPAHDTIQSWVCAEIGERYDVLPHQVDDWLSTASLTLLLDGLDEVGPAHRDHCLRTLNSFTRDPQYSGTGIVLTCRLRDYEYLNDRLRFDIAVCVRELSRDQVHQSLANAGPKLMVLRNHVASDATFADLLTTPLMVGIAVLAYSNSATGGPASGDSPTELSATLYRDFISAMLTRDRSLRNLKPSIRPPFELRDTYWFLTWLAKMMAYQQQTVFYPDWLTPAWLPGRSAKWGPSDATGITAWLARRLGWDHTSTGLVGAYLAFVIGAGSTAPFGALLGGLQGALLVSLSCGVFLGLGVGVTFGVLIQIPILKKPFVPLIGNEDENPYAASRWTWSWRRSLRGLLIWTIFGLIAIGLPLGIAYDPGAGLIVALILGLSGALSGGSVPDISKPPASPGRALQASLRQFMRLIISLLSATAVVVVLVFLQNGPWTAVVASLPLATALMLTAGPGRAWLRNRAVNFGIARARFLPKNLLTFLQFADERIILQRTFGGFAFIHRTMRDYLAGQDPTRPAPGHSPRADAG